MMATAADHRARQERASAALRDAGLDAVVLGRPSTVAYLSGVRRVLVRGSRPFAPMAVLVAATGELYLQSANEGGMPPEIGHERLYPMSWDPRSLVAGVAALPGLGAARRVGVDGMTPGAEAALAAALPEATFVPAEHLLRPAFETWSDTGLAAVRAGVEAVAAGMAAVDAALRPGVRELQLRGVFYGAVAERGVVALATEGTTCVLGPDGALRRLSDDRRVGDGDLVALDFAVLVDGVEGGYGRTVGCGDAPALSRLAERWRRARDAVVAACRADATGAELQAAYATVEPHGPMLPLAYPYGAGAEPPLSASDRLRPGMVVAVQAFVSEPGAGGFLGRDMVLVRDDGPELLTAER